MPNELKIPRVGTLRGAPDSSLYVINFHLFSEMQVFCLRVLPFEYLYDRAGLLPLTI